MKLACYDRFWVRKGPWKYVVDGAFSPHSAWLGEAYSGEEHNTGKAVLQPLQLARLVKQAARHKRQAAFHAIGDRAVHEVVNAVEKASNVYPWISSLRFRLEHAQIIRPEDMPRIKKLGLLVSAQPTALSQPEKDFALVGAERFRLLYPYNSLLKTGVNLSFGSDIPGEIEYNPLVAIERAVTRRGEMKRGGRSASDLEYDKREGITPYQALYCYTMGSAYAEFMENHKGSLVAGKLADLVLLADDPTRVPQQEIGQIPMLLTVVGGKIVYANQEIKI
jgi:predicted amidohydrolase YtcJ